MSRTSARTIILAVACAAAGSACTHADSAPAVATVSLHASRTKVALGSPLDLTYRFTVAPGAKIDGDYHVFVHVEEQDTGQQMWTDDHEPPTPTSQWKPGQTIEYTRTIFVPVFPYLGPANVRVGLYQGNDRLPLAGSDDIEQRAVKVATLEMLPQSENIALWYRSGWQAAEFAPDNPAMEWQWTQKDGVLSFRNPKADATLFLEYDARPDLFSPPQQVTVSAGGQQVASFAADNPDRTLLRIPIPAADFGTDDMSEIQIDVDRTFVPANLPAAGSKDQRELGIRVYHAFLQVK